MDDNLKDKPAVAVTPTETNQDSVEQSKNSSSKFGTKKNLVLKVAVLVVVLVGIVGAVWLYTNQTKPTYISSTTDSKKPVILSIPGDISGRGMSFESPGFLKEVSGENTGTTRGLIRLQTSAKDNKSLTDTARLYAYVKDYSSPSLPNQQYLDELAKTFAQDPSSPGYKRDTALLKEAVQKAYIEPSFSAELGVAKPFTNKYIKGNAWQIDVTAHDSSGYTSDHKGVLIYVAGYNGVYKLLASAVASDWQSDSAVWQKVLDSIRVDQ